MEHGVATLAPGLIITWISVAASFLALLALIYIAVRNRRSTLDVEKAVQAFRSLDIAAFRNIVDPAEEAFLRSNLPPGEFREIKRQRAWAALLYTWEAGKAATALAAVGQAAQRSSDPKIAASGVQLAESAFRLRLQSIEAGLRLLPGMVMPDLQIRTLSPVVEQYEQASETLLRAGAFSSGMQRLVRSRSA